jgi:hypothetical protein
MANLSQDKSTGESNSVNFSTFILSLASATFIELGVIEDPLSKTKKKDLSSAKQHIDLLEMLQEKTRGNLDDEERGLLERILRDVRLQFVKASEG